MNAMSLSVAIEFSLVAEDREGKRLLRFGHRRSLATHEKK